MRTGHVKAGSGFAIHRRVRTVGEEFGSNITSSRQEVARRVIQQPERDARFRDCHVSSSSALGHGRQGVREATYKARNDRSGLPEPVGGPVKRKGGERTKNRQEHRDGRADHQDGKGKITQFQEPSITPDGCVLDQGRTSPDTHVQIGQVPLQMEPERR